MDLKDLTNYAFYWPIIFFPYSHDLYVFQVFFFFFFFAYKTVHL